MGLRQLIVGPITGLSSYELAIKYGLFTGTEAEYAAKEQQVFNEIIEYTKTVKQEIAESLNGLGIDSNGSWFLKNGISSLNGVTTNIRTIMGDEVTIGKPASLKENSVCTFECNTVNDENGNPIFSRQIIVEITPDNNMNVYHRGQIIDGEVVVDNWTNWEPINEYFSEGDIKLYTGNISIQEMLTNNDFTMI